MTRVRTMAPVTERDWYTWHRDYDSPGTALGRRLAAVQAQIRVALDAAKPGPLCAISLCAGQGRDLIGALAGHPRQHDVRARLVELDPRNADAARQAAQAAGLPEVEVVTGDAALTDAYAGMTPADLVLVCGVFGNMTDADIERTVGYCTQLCARDGTVVWTRGRWAPDLLPQICDWFAGRGFDELWVSDPAEGWGAAAHRFTGTPDPLEPGARMFTFRGHYPRTGPPRRLSLWTERIVVHAAAPVNPRSGLARPGAALWQPLHSSPPGPVQRHGICLISPIRPTAYSRSSVATWWMRHRTSSYWYNVTSTLLKVVPAT
jgi:hypothetical protein